MFTEDDLIPISALQHMLFCERQYALIHLEQVWEENRYTAEGRVLHERVDEEHHESRGLSRIEYAMALRSLRYGIVGKADVVEFEKHAEGGYVLIRPVEYKRGRRKEKDWDRVQLCAQALCLEETFHSNVLTGQFYYLQERRRTTVEFDSDLRAKTVEVIGRIRSIMESGRTPGAVYSKRTCDRCSLLDLCMPKVLSKRGKSVTRYIQSRVRAAALDDAE